MGFVMNGNWQSSENYINNQFLKESRTVNLIKTVEVSYKAVPIGDSDAKENEMKINAFSFFCDDFLIYAETKQDEFILGVNNHTYLEFKRVVANGDESKNRFRLIGVRSVDSLNQHQVVLLQGVLLAPKVDYLSL